MLHRAGEAGRSVQSDKRCERPGSPAVPGLTWCGRDCPGAMDNELIVRVSSRYPPGRRPADYRERSVGTADPKARAHPRETQRTEKMERVSRHRSPSPELPAAK